MCQSIGKNRSLKTLNLTGIRLRKAFLKHCLEKALETNITLGEVIGNIPAEILSGELGTNTIIREEIQLCYEKRPKITKKLPYDFSIIDKQHTSFLNVSSKPSYFIRPSFKFMHFHEVRAVDFSNCEFDDTHVEFLCNYLSRNPALYSVTMNNNPLTDTAITMLAAVLRTNIVLAHLSFKGCKNVTNDGLRELLDAVTYYNMILFEINLDPE